MTLHLVKAAEGEGAVNANRGFTDEDADPQPEIANKYNPGGYSGPWRSRCAQPCEWRWLVVISQCGCMFPRHCDIFCRAPLREERLQRAFEFID